MGSMVIFVGPELDEELLEDALLEPLLEELELVKPPELALEPGATSVPAGPPQADTPKTTNTPTMPFNNFIIYPS